MVLTNAQWLMLEPLIQACRPHHKTEHHDLRQTIEAIIWRCQNGAKWRSIPAEFRIVFLDGTNIRAHPRGGFDTRACVIADAAGRAIEVRLAPGQAHGLPLLPDLVASLPDTANWIVADTG